MDSQHDARVRVAAFEWLAGQVAQRGDELPRDLLAQGFRFEDARVPLLGPQGIFKPRILELPLSITTAPSGPYDDDLGEDGLLHYRYRGTDPQHRDNWGLRAMMERRLPLIYLHGIATGKYWALWPAYVVGDNPGRLTFSIEVDDPKTLPLVNDNHAIPAFEPDEARRRYVTGSVRVRLHQRTFRERVLVAYRRRCAFCRFKHEEMLDAAHIIPDGDPEGEPVVRNGLSLCSLHHAAFDRNLLGLRPDLTLEVRPDILVEHDGPTLEHGIQALHNTRIILPAAQKNHPDRHLVEKRYSRFLLAI